MISIDSKHHQAHSGFYLTLVSIMQGLALGYLLQVLTAEVTSLGYLTLLTTFQALTSLVIIVIVWHEYAIGTILFRWKLDLLDSAIPFLFGIAQYVMIAAISIPTTNHILSQSRFSLWLWTQPAFCLVSCVAYWNQYKKAIVDEDAKYVKSAPRRNFFQALVTAAVFGLIAVSNSTIHFTNSAQWLSAFCIAAAFIGHALRINCAYEKRTQIS